jgi:phage pi2 protein 07
MNELIERLSIKMARLNNGGEWHTHYTEAQKNLWRAIAKEIIEDVQTELNKAVEYNWTEFYGQGSEPWLDNEQT